MIPWVLDDSNCVCGRYQKLDPSKTVFVGGLHGMLNAGWLDFGFQTSFFSTEVKVKSSRMLC